MICLWRRSLPDWVEGVEIWTPRNNLLNDFKDLLKHDPTNLMYKLAPTILREVLPHNQIVE